MKIYITRVSNSTFRLWANWTRAILTYQPPPWTSQTGSSSFQNVDSFEASSAPPMSEYFPYLTIHRNRFLATFQTTSRAGFIPRALFADFPRITEEGQNRTILPLGSTKGATNDRNFMVLLFPLRLPFIVFPDRYYSWPLRIWETNCVSNDYKLAKMNVPSAYFYKCLTQLGQWITI